MFRGWGEKNQGYFVFAPTLTNSSKGWNAVYYRSFLLQQQFRNCLYGWARTAPQMPVLPGIDYESDLEKMTGELR
jgi:hypothetical protein